MWLVVLVGCGVNGGPGEIVADGDLWWRPFGGRATDEGWGIDVDAAGDVYVATHEGHPRVVPDIYVRKLSPAGEVLWEASFDGGGSDLAYVVEEDAGVVYVGGAAFRAGWLDSAEAFLAAYDAATGERLWWTIWDGEDGYEEVDGIALSAGRMWISGWTKNDGAMDALLQEIDPTSGDVIWTRKIGLERFDEANGRLHTDGEALYFAGRRDASGLVSGGHATITSYDFHGNERWQATWLHDGTDGALKDALGLGLYGGELVAVGLVAGEAGAQSALGLWGCDVEGHYTWELIWEGLARPSARALVRDEAGWLIPVNHDGEGRDLAMVRLDDAGEIVVLSTWAGSRNEEFHDLVLSGDGGFLVGQSTSVERSADAVVVRFGDDGLLPGAPD